MSFLYAQTWLQGDCMNYNSDCSVDRKTFRTVQRFSNKLSIVNTHWYNQPKESLTQTHFQKLEQSSSLERKLLSIGARKVQASQNASLHLLAEVTSWPHPVKRQCIRLIFSEVYLTYSQSLYFLPCFSQNVECIFLGRNCFPQTISKLQNKRTPVAPFLKKKNAA